MDVDQRLEPGQSAGNIWDSGAPASSNAPGSREAAVGWTDAAGNLWLFSGRDYDPATGEAGELNDLWKYSDGEWTWISGSNVFNQQGVYGTEGTSAPNNVPGARESAVGWTDAAGNLWLFGGDYYYSIQANGGLNDLWKYSAGQWTWMSGSNMPNEAGTLAPRDWLPRATFREHGGLLLVRPMGPGTSGSSAGMGTTRPVQP
jgi:hypothetical protein